LFNSTSKTNAIFEKIISSFYPLCNLVVFVSIRYFIFKESAAALSKVNCYPAFKSTLMRKEGSNKYFFYLSGKEAKNELLCQ
jgi:hypothetical protein